MLTKQFGVVFKNPVVDCPVLGRAFIFQMLIDNACNCTIQWAAVSHSDCQHFVIAPLYGLLVLQSLSYDWLLCYRNGVTWTLRV